MFGEVYLCEFPFTSGAHSKIRPALVLFDLKEDAVICRITSVQRSGPFDVTLVGWQAAGLLKPSVARIDCVVTAEKTIFTRRLGKLTPDDAARVRAVWNQTMKL
ncbi:MAG: type II toxin-antitoxin system PemK/MazF family toxin [Opitutae bacterium]|nr:type II toxin-antitoxin system PemK/MazF family toxin [Opitutae bacterium]